MKLKTALIFDDDPTCREVLTEILEDKQFRVKSFAGPGFYLPWCEVTERCRLGHPCCDVLLTDNLMPGMTGIEFLEALREKGCNIPAQRQAIISGIWTHEQISRAEKIGCHIFYKPTQIVDINAWLDE